MTVVSRTRLVEVARSYIGTPFGHLGRTPGVSLDCVGLFVCAAAELGLQVPDWERYPPFPKSEELLGVMRSFATEIDPKDAQRGDALVIKVGRNPTHLAMKTPTGIVHAYNRCARLLRGETLSRVREEPLSSRWRVVTAFELPGVCC